MVPAGAFRMGDLSGGGDADEGPVRTVTIPRAFAVARYETTFAQWDACAASGACRQGVSDIGFGRGARPVILVTREEAQAYAGWLSRLTGKSFRLPSEAEWEYMARAGSETKYPWGNDIGRGRANCDECGSRWDDDRTSPVGSFPANAFGVHDAVGNVYEWVADCGRSSYDGAPSDGSVGGAGRPNMQVEHDARRLLGQPAAGEPPGQPGPHPGRIPGHQHRLSGREKPVLIPASLPARPSPGGFRSRPNGATAALSLPVQPSAAANLGGYVGAKKALPPEWTNCLP